MACKSPSLFNDPSRRSKAAGLDRETKHSVHYDHAISGLVSLAVDLFKLRVCSLLLEHNNPYNYQLNDKLRNYSDFLFSSATALLM